MRRVCIGLFALILFLAWPSNSLADGIALSGAILDWSGMTFTETGGLPSPILANNFSESTATTNGGASFDSTNNVFPFLQIDTTTSASSQYLNSTANGAALALTDNGFVTSSSQAFTTAQHQGANSVLSDAFSLSITTNSEPIPPSFSVTISIPYTLYAICDSFQSQGTTTDYITAADATLFVALIGVGGESFAKDTVDCQNNPGIKTGVFTLTEESGANPEVVLEVATSAEAEVPEPSTLLLLCVGFLGLAGTSLRKRFV
jgi:hypothetical protein